MRMSFDSLDRFDLPLHEMVSARILDAVRNPSSVIIDLYDEGRNTQTEFPPHVTSHFSTVFDTQDSVQQIPPLSLNHPPTVHPDRSLVRFRAMIQDISSPEMYLSRLPGGRCGGWNIYQDITTPGSADINLRDLRERSVFWAITVPGESQWHAGRLERTLFNKAPDVPSIPPYITRNCHKLPNPRSTDFGVFLKIYDEALTKDLKFMTVATFVGILAWESIGTETEAESLALPVLHVTNVQVPTPESPPEPPRNTVTAVYENLVDWVSQEALAGDKVAAEFVILCSVARVQSRNPPILPPSLQLTGVPRPNNGSSTPAICSILSKLLPLFSVVGLSLEALNNDRFVPESNGEDLSSGYLQVPAGSVVLLTEIGIKEGNIIEKGVRNLRDVQHVMSNQSLRCVFPFSQFSFHTDIGFILIVEGRRSPFFTTDISLPLQPQIKDTTRLYKDESEIKMPDHQQLDAFRDLLSGAKRGKNLTVSKQVAELIEHDFVEERKVDKSVTQHDLATKITIARLLGRLFRADELSIDLWERAKGLEAERKKRSQVQGMAAN